MPPLLRFLIHRLISIPITLFIITVILYGFVMLTPVEARATLYFPKGLNPDRMTNEELQRFTEVTIKKWHLDEPFPVQYSLWVSNLVRGKWGWSPVLGEDVLPALLRRTPVSAELMLYSFLVFIPLGLISGIRAGANKDRPVDLRFRLAAFIGISFPTFIMALILMRIFYVGLYWFPPERLGFQSSRLVASEAFRTFTGLLTIDGLLNGRPEISLEALRHLVLPVVTLSIAYWGILGRVTRAAVIDETSKEYIIAAEARGISQHDLVWKHMGRNALTPALTSSILSAAALFTSMFVVEIIFGFRGVSSLIAVTFDYVPDVAILLGFAIYSVVVVLLMMLALDLLIAILDPRVREEVISR